VCDVIDIKEERLLSLKSTVLVALFKLSFAKPDPQVKTTVINITETTINNIVAINGETDLLNNIIKKIEEINVYKINLMG
jgi:hypothetical protein